MLKRVYNKFEDEKYLIQMEVIVDKTMPTKRKVFYEPVEDIFLKVIYISFFKKILCFFRLRIYPGINFKIVSDFLKKNKINVPEIIYFSKYKVVTKNINGISMSQALIESDINSSKKIIKQYTVLVSLIIKSGIFFPDIHFNNFIVKNNKLYAIDLDAYKIHRFYYFKKNKLLNIIKNQKLKKCCDKQLVFSKEKISDDKKLGELKQILDSNKIWKDIEKIL